MSSIPHTLLTTPRRLAPVSLGELRPGWAHKQTAVATAVCAGRVDALVYWFELDNGPRHPGGTLNTGPKSNSHWCQVKLDLRHHPIAREPELCLDRSFMSLMKCVFVSRRLQ